MKFIDNGRIAWIILEYAVACYPPYVSAINIENMLDWLKLSSSVDAVTIDTTKYDDCLAYCSKAWDYEEAKSDLMSLLTTELVRFHFAWGALESLLAEFVPQTKIERFGKINALCGYLKIASLGDLLPNGYLEEYSHLVGLMEIASQYKSINTLESLASKQSQKSYVDIAGMGIYSVYRIRNKFAHGSMTFPEPEEYGEGAKQNKELIVVATRIVLMTIIMLFVNDIKNDDFMLDPDRFNFVKELEFDSYEYSLLVQLDKHNLGIPQITAIQYLRNLCIDIT